MQRGFDVQRARQSLTDLKQRGEATMLPPLRDCSRSRVPLHPDCLRPVDTFLWNAASVATELSLLSSSKRGRELGPFALAETLLLNRYISQTKLSAERYA